MGYRSIQTEVKTWHYDNRWPEKRKQVIDYWTELLLSGADALVAEKYVEQEVVTAAQKELHAVSKDPNAVFFYSFIQATAKT